MNIRLARRVDRVKPSPTLAVTARANALRAAGEDIIGLGAGEPDFDTPAHIKAAAITAIQNGQTKYTAVDGTAELKQAIIEKFSRDNQLSYEPEQILVSSGGKQSFYNLCQALLDSGDEVIIPAPYWVSYPDMVLLADGKPVIIDTDQSANFCMTAEQLESAITPHTRLVVINSPSNPTGMAYSHAQLKALAEILLKHPDVLVATDDMYEHILWHDEPFANILMVCPDLYNRTIVLNGVSKAYSMTGWRIGYAGGPVQLMKAMKKVQSQSTSNPASISQAAATAAISGDQSCIANMVGIFKQRHDKLVAELNSVEGITCLPGHGTFYAFPNVREFMQRFDGIENDVELAEMILNKVGVAVVPGSAFGSEGFMRLSFATSDENLTNAMARIKSL